MVHMPSSYSSFANVADFGHEDLCQIMSIIFFLLEEKLKLNQYKLKGDLQVREWIITHTTPQGLVLKVHSDCIFDLNILS